MTISLIILWASFSTCGLLCALGYIRATDRMHARERSQWKRILRMATNVQTIGAAEARPVEVARSIDAEERVQRMVSEDTIAKGVTRLRAEYTSARMRVPTDEELRSEVISMLGGNEPVIEMLTLPRD